MTNYIYIILCFGALWYFSHYKEPFIGKHVTTRYNINNRYFRKVINRMGGAIRRTEKKLIRFVK